ncbi:hypothetical protein BCR32DRAFT_268565 [Anaeromyces robustus]|uniref:G-protein coupled receptors family 3 profile domain-containing protein n=1 Tax=Anaeromyces robustus TaxID=1754192 RepID=A0A1Y1X5C0_9FUNG|nr:hypothetical protein BCR32DRAFT_268565 [Anaeromyces robustus]|eukprot:ORX80973.1 hypothetical protein BCR32DRAFT_268565 [Anaeromyces robustus]
MKYILFYTILLFILCAFYGNAIIIEAVAFSRDVNDQVYIPFINDFNNYSKEHNLNITVNLNLLTRLNTTYSITDFGSMVEVLLKKKTTKYDIFFYDNLYTSKYEPYLLDLNEFVPKELLDQYNDDIIAQTCIFNNRLVGIPAKMGFSVLYSNEEYLNKYNKRIPKTWEELLQTAKYIIAEEKKLNNTDLIAYNGLFNDSESGFCSIYEFIYSYRNSVDSPFPEFSSNEAINALEMIKRLKNEIASDDYAEKIKFHFFNFLYGNSTAYEELQKIDDITRIHYISFFDKNSIIGIINSILLIFLILFAGLLIVFLFFENYSPFFEFLPTDFWIILVIGLIIGFSTCVIEFGKLNNQKCNLKLFLLTYSITLVYIPILYKLIINFPEKTKFTIWIFKHKYIFLLFFISIDILIYILMIKYPYNIENIIINDGQNFQRCKMTSIPGHIIVVFNIATKCILYIIILILTFMEWSIIDTYYDVRFISVAIYISTISLTLYFIVDIIQINNFKAYFIIHEYISIVMGISNYILLYGYRVINGFLKGKNLKSLFINEICILNIIL